MKKLLFVFSVVFLFSGCYEEYLLVINNESSFDVTFNLTTGHRTEDYLLEAGKQFSHSMIERHSHAINDYEPKENVILSNDGNTYTFKNTPPPETPVPPDPVPASILNTLPKDVILSGDGAISTDPLKIKANTEITTEKIIKDDPIFSAKTTDGYPVQVDYLYDEKSYKIILR